MLMGKAVLDLASPVVGRLWRARERGERELERACTLLHVDACMFDALLSCMCALLQLDPTVGSGVHIC